MLLNEQDKTLRRYLLGELSEKEQEALELWLMSEEEAYDQLSAAEDDLIDESLAGKLNRHELERFNNQFLTAPARKRKLWFGQAFRKFVDAKSTRVVPSVVPTPAFSLWDLFRYRPVFAYAASALFVLVVGSGVWAGSTIHNMQERLATTTQLAGERQLQLDESQALGERLQSDFRAIEQAVANLKTSAPQAFLAIVPMAGLTRSPADVPKITLTPKTQFVELSLTVLDDRYDSYRAVLLNGAGKELWDRDGLRPSGENKSIVLMIPSDRFSSGDYRIRLSGRSASKPPENITVYSMHATR